jgi:hypothetical protein
MSEVRNGKTRAPRLSARVISVCADADLAACNIALATFFGD